MSAGPGAVRGPRALWARAELYRTKGWWRRGGTTFRDFRRHATAAPDKPAVVARSLGDHPDERRTYGELADAVDRIASALLARGVGSGDVVSFQLPNWWEFAAVALVCDRLGAIGNPIPPIMRQRELAHMLSVVRSRVVFVPGEFRGHDHAATIADLAPSLPDLRHVVVVAGTPRAGQEALEADLLDEPADGAALEALPEPGPDDVAQVQFTSGTTGRPKGVLHTHNTLRAGYRGLIEVLGLGSDDVVLAASTMAHASGYLGGMALPLTQGMTAVYLDRWDARTMLQLVEQHGVTYTSGPATFMTDACELAERERFNTSSLRWFKSGGSPVPPEFAARLANALGARLVMAWGMTENGNCTLAVIAPDCPADEQHAGYALPWVELRTVPVKGVPPGQGALHVRSASQCVGYFPDGALLEAALDEEGWFDTGDLAEIVADGGLRLTGRLKETIIRGGENVPVVEVEQALRAHPAVRDCAVVGVPDPRLGERACAVVVPERHDRHPDLAELTAQLSELGMARQYWPESLVLVDALPRTDTGKVRRVEARAVALTRLGEGALASEGPDGGDDKVV